jgi:hypothetical protein
MSQFQNCPCEHCLDDDAEEFEIDWDNITDAEDEICFPDDGIL